MTRKEAIEKFGLSAVLNEENFDWCFQCAGDGIFAHDGLCEDCGGTGKQSEAERLMKLESFK